MAIVDISFSNPEMLWYLLSIPLMFLSHFILLLYTKRKAIRFANFEALKRVSKDNFLTKNMTVLFLRLGILAFLILAIADPTMWYTAQSNKNDFVFAIDVSASMGAEDVAPSRIEAAKDAAALFVNSVKSQSRFGLVTFSGTPFIMETLTDSKSSITSAIYSIRLERAGGTDIGGAIITSTNLLLPSEKGRTIILITDGSNTAGTFTENPVQKAVNYALRNHVIVHTIGLGTNVGPIGYLPEYYNISAVFDESTLSSISNQTSGLYFRAATPEELQNAYVTLAQKSEEALLGYDLRYGLMLLALMLLFVEWGLINTKFRSIP